MPTFVPEAWDEVQDTVDQLCGTDGIKWRAINVYKSSSRVTNALISRMTLGLPFCRNEALRYRLRAFADHVWSCVAIEPLIPGLLKPILGWTILTLPAKWHYLFTRSQLLPRIHSRLSEVAAAKQDTEKLAQLPDDYLTWHIRHATAQNDPKALEPEFMSLTLLSLELSAGANTHHALANLLFDIFSSPPDQDVVQILRAELQEMYINKYNGTWSQKCLRELYRMDSAIKESLRFSTITAHGTWRKVRAREGLLDPETGDVFPCGTTLGWDIWSRHHDTDIYEEPMEYDALRFYRMREQMLRDGGDALQLKKLSMTVAGSDLYLVFSTGRHAWYVDTVPIMW